MSVAGGRRRAVFQVGPGIHGVRFTNRSLEEEEAVRQQRASSHRKRRVRSGKGAASYGARGMTARSARRYMRAIGATDWRPLVEAGVVLVTLTYPDGLWSMDGKVNRRHWDRFRDRWAYRYGGVQGTMVVEFQERGAPHFHAYLAMPALSVGETEAWCRESWAAVIGAGDEVLALWHAEGCGVTVERLPFFHPERAGAYFWAHNAKVAQKRPPQGYENPGRSWVIFGLERRLYEVEGCFRAGVEMVRFERKLVDRKRRRRCRKRASGAMRRLGRTACRKASYRAVVGLWALSDDGLGSGLALKRAAEVACGCRSCVPSAVMAGRRSVGRCRSHGVVGCGWCGRRAGEGPAGDPLVGPPALSAVCEALTLFGGDGTESATVSGAFQQVPLR